MRGIDTLPDPIRGELESWVIALGREPSEQEIVAKVLELQKPQTAPPDGLRIERVPMAGDSVISIPPAAPPKTFTTQLVPTLVFNAAKALVDEMLALPYPRSYHHCLMIHPNDWHQLGLYMTQQGTLQQTQVAFNNISSLEISGVTVMPDLSAKVPHLELSV